MRPAESERMRPAGEQGASRREKAGGRTAARLFAVVLVLLAGLAVVLGLVIGGVLPVAGTSSGDAGTTAAAPLTPQQIFRQSAAGVVEVRAAFAPTDQSQSPTGGQGLGSGFVVSEDGVILTNDHVVTNGGQDASSIVVVFRSTNRADPSESRVSAKLLGGDPESDVAVLKIDPAEAPVVHPLPLGDSAAIEVGEPVVAIGNPLGFSFSVSSGIVSATGRNLRSPNGSVIPNGIQTDAAINSGNSGGPLIDGAGKVIGINTMIASHSGGSQGLGFAVPIATGVRVMRQIVATGAVSYAYLGVSGQTLSPNLAGALGLTTSHGVLVAQVGADSPAAAAGIRPGTHTVSLQGQPFIVGGDVITAIDGEAMETSEDITAAIAAREPGDTITLTVVRDGTEQTKQIQLGARSASG